MRHLIPALWAAALALAVLYVFVKLLLFGLSHVQSL